MSDNGYLAYPVPMDSRCNGLTKREYFAGQALAGLCANKYGPPHWGSIAENAAHVADLLIEALEGSDD